MVFIPAGKAPDMRVESLPQPWMDEILQTKEYEKEQENITKLGENQVFYLPYLMGERSPHNDPLARAAFVGMTMDTTREEMTQAVKALIYYRYSFFFIY